MAEIVLFHHALGLTPGCLAFAELLRTAGHTIHTPDLYDGATFTTLADGVAHAESIGFDAVVERGQDAAADLPQSVVYAGMSLGAMPAMSLAQNRPGAKAAILLHSAVPLEAFGGTWPAGLRLQIHTRADDAWGDADVAHQLTDQIDTAELFLYPGDQHLFTDSSLADYDETATALVLERVRQLLAGL